MFVREKTHRKTLKELIDARRDLLYMQTKFLGLLSEWNALIRKINAKGGEAFLEGRLTKNNQFDKEEIDRLIRLCHPDKHGQSKVSVEMTQKLLSLRR